MKFSKSIQAMLCCAACAAPAAAISHVALAEGAAPAGSLYKAVFGISHGCAGSPTTSVAVYLPPGFQAAKPMPKAGWTLVTQVEKAAGAAGGAGKPGADDVAVVRWRSATPDAALADAHYDEFVLRGRLPAQEGPIWFRILQTCENGSHDWREIPAAGVSTQGLKSPAVLLQVRPSTSTQHHH